MNIIKIKELPIIQASFSFLKRMVFDIFHCYVLSSLLQEFLSLSSHFTSCFLNLCNVSSCYHFYCFKSLATSAIFLGLHFNSYRIAVHCGRPLDWSPKSPEQTTMSNIHTHTYKTFLLAFKNVTQFECLVFFYKYGETCNVRKHWAGNQSSSGL